MTNLEALFAVELNEVWSTKVDSIVVTKFFRMHEANDTQDTVITYSLYPLKYRLTRGFWKVTTTTTEFWMVATRSMGTS